MKKMLSFIMIAALATSGLFALTVNTVNDANDANVALPSILLRVTAEAVPFATILLNYVDTEVTTVNPITDGAWHIQDASATDYDTDLFHVVFYDGVIAASPASSSETYQVSVTPGAFIADVGGATAFDNAAGDNPIIPIATHIAEGNLTSALNDPTLLITTNAIVRNQYIDSLTVASFTLGWTSADYNTYLNEVGSYTSTSTVYIRTI
jgi:hypothetical protein